MRIGRRTCLGMLGAFALGSLPAAAAVQSPCGCQSSEGTMLAFGDSITAYTGASDQAHGFTSLIAAGLGVGQDNRGLSGDVAAGMLAIIRTTPVPTRYDVVIWLCGFNDNLINNTDATALATFQANVEAGLLQLTSRRRQPDATGAKERLLLRRGKLASVADGCDVWVGNCIRPSNYATPVAPYNNGSDAGMAAHNVAIAAAVTNVAAQGRRVHLVDVSTAYDTATMVSGDQVHPNDTGHAYLASTFLGAMHS